MNRLVSKIPLLRSLARVIEKRKFENKWRKKNRHNETKVAGREFPVDIVVVGKGTYGTINIQSLYVTPEEKLSIGNYVSIAPQVTFMLGVNHQINTATTFPFHSKLIQRSPIDAVSKGPISVEDEVWIGSGAMILSGITIGKGAIIAAGSVVTKSVPRYAIVGGNPAKLIRFRFSEEVIEVLSPIHFANLPDQWIKQNIDAIYKEIKTVDDALRFKALVDSYQAKEK
jgi:acetyltransferase-like isoleucine patch superfamily enzyme